MKKTIGEKIRWLRQRRGSSQKIIADLLGISVPAFWKIENGATDISISRLKQIAAIFEIKASDILDQDDPGAYNEDSQVNGLKDRLINSEQEVIRLQKRLLLLYEDVEKYITRSC